MNQRNPNRSSSHGRKVLPSHARPSKAAPHLKRNHSYNHANVQIHASRPSTGKRNVTGPVKTDTSNEEDEMAGFLEFCTTCEKQIVSPGSSLYCSEACRRMDDAKPSPLMLPQSPPLSPSSAAYIDLHLPDILPQMSPTVPHSTSFAFSNLTMDDLFPEDERPESSGHNSNSFEATPEQDESSIETPAAYSRWSSSNLPSLIHSTSSSYASNASHLPTSRPLPTRRNKSYSIYSNEPLDLWPTQTMASPPKPPDAIAMASSVHSGTSVQTAIHVGGGSSPPAARKESGSPASLKELFKHSAMTAPPAEAKEQQ